MNTNILLIGYSHIPSYDLTVKDFSQFASAIPFNFKTKLTKEVVADDIEWCDVLYMVRGDNPLDSFVVKKASSVGKKIILGLDDDLAEYRNNDLKENKLCGKAFQEVLDKADYIITPSFYLGEKYKKQYGKDYILLDTVINKSQLKSYKKTDSEEIKLLYAASRGHKSFFDSIVAPLLNPLYEKYGDKVSLTVIGPEVNANDFSMNINVVNPMPLHEYRTFMNNYRFDIGLAPLFDLEFCRSKYYNKFLEYTINGICGIYSNVLPYNAIVKDGVNGFLVDNNQEDWLARICDIIDDNDKRHKCVERAQEQLISDFSLEGIVSKMKIEMNDTFVYKSEKINNSVCNHMKIRYVLYALYRNSLKTFDTIRTRGYKGLFKELRYRLSM